MRYGVPLLSHVFLISTLPSHPLDLLAFLDAGLLYPLDLQAILDAGLLDPLDLLAILDAGIVAVSWVVPWEGLHIYWYALSLPFEY